MSSLPSSLRTPRPRTGISGVGEGAARSRAASRRARATQTKRSCPIPYYPSMVHIARRQSQNPRLSSYGDAAIEAPGRNSNLLLRRRRSGRPSAPCLSAGRSGASSAVSRTLGSEPTRHERLPCILPRTFDGRSTIEDPSGSPVTCPATLKDPPPVSLVIIGSFRCRVPPLRSAVLG